MPVIPKRVVVVVNKWWECDPVMNVLLHNKARPKGLLWPSLLNHPRPRPTDLPLPPRLPSGEPRAVYSHPAVGVEVWCLADLLDDLPDRTKYQSSTQRKAAALLRIFGGRYPDLVIAVGTAGYPVPKDENRTENGSVVVGWRTFIHNFHPNGSNPFSDWNAGPFDAVLESALTPADFAAFVPDTASVTTRFVRPPNQQVGDSGAKLLNEMHLIAEPDAVSVGVVNVTDYAEYDHSDQAAMDSFTTHSGGATAVSLETTHGLIRAMFGQAIPDFDKRTDPPFLFISGITDRVGHFADEVSKNEYSQNFAASHNMGVVLAWMIPNLVDALSR